MSSVPRAPKRRRTSSVKRERNLEEITQSSMVWYDDGSVILQAENTLFKCHRGILAEHSVVFRDLFSLATPDDEKLVEGCPVLQISDTADDVECFLRAIYDGGNKAILVPLPLPTVSAMLRLGRKYQIEFLQEDAVNRLSTAFPSNLEEYVSLQKNPSNSLIEFEEDFLTAYLEVISLACSHDLQKILASAYFMLLSSSKLDSTFGIRSEGPGLGVLSMPELQILTMVNLVPARTTLMDHIYGWAIDIDPFAGCRGGPTLRCNLRITKSFLKAALDNRNSFGILCKDHDYFVELCGNMFCKPCTTAVADSIVAGQVAFWNAIPSLFAMSPWERLSNAI